MIRVAIFRPGEEQPEFGFIDESLPALQALVGGYIEAVQLSRDLVLICNEEGKLLGLPGTRFIIGAQIRDLVCGTFFVCRSKAPNFASLQPEDEIRLNEWSTKTMWDLNAGVLMISSVM